MKEKVLSLVNWALAGWGYYIWARGAMGIFACEFPVFESCLLLLFLFSSVLWVSRILHRDYRICWIKALGMSGLVPYVTFIASYPIVKRLAVTEIYEFPLIITLCVLIIAIISGLNAYLRRA